MTYKNTLLKYFTGNLEKNTGNNVIQFGDYKVVNKSMRQQIAEQLGATLNQVVVRGGVSSVTDNKNLLYGINTSNSKNFIAIFNQQMEIIQVITTFSTGSDLFNIVSIQMDDNGEMYGLSRDNETLRVLLFNNIFASGLISGEYSVTLRKDYIIPTSANILVTTQATKDVIKKVPGEATYYITGYDNSSNTYTKVVKFKINVGSENTWDTYTIGTNVFYGQSKFTIIITKENDAPVYYAYALDIINDKYVVYKIDDEGNITNVKSINLSGEVMWTGSQVLAINEDNVYLAIGNGTSHESIIYKVAGNNLNVLETDNWWQDAGDTYHPVYDYLQNINGSIFVTKYQPYRYSIQVFVGIIIDNNIYYKPEPQISSIEIDYDNFNLLLPYTNTYINNQYNLYNLYIDSDYNGQVYGGYLNMLSFVYNPNNYNGEAYENVNALVPNYGVIYNNNIPIFARNLYNKTINNNTTISTIEIPNTLLNDVSIQQKSLFGETNLLLTTNDTVFTKNIYENVLLNFYQTLIMQNRNDLDNIITNNLGASYLNESATLKTNYDDIKAVKVRVNYEDNTSNIITLSPNTQIVIDTTDNTKATYTFNFYVTKTIQSIEIISNDENMVYQTITGDFKINYSYKIKQDVRIITQ